MTEQKKIGVYPGTFDPVTNGHLDIIERGYELFDFLYIAVAENIYKKTVFSVDERVAMLKKATSHLPNVEVVVCENKLVVDFANQIGAKTILRGLRALTDFEYEFQIAMTNKSLQPDIETVFLMTKAENMFLSSSATKEVARFNGDVSSFVPEFVKDELRLKFNLDS
ncbi:MAG: pantetheine-phosphate adenylyltransferase [Turicibacter sp.]